jgi:hypothetical protein
MEVVDQLQHHEALRARASRGWPAASLRPRQLHHDLKVRRAWRALPIPLQRSGQPRQQSDRPCEYATSARLAAGTERTREYTGNIERDDPTSDVPHPPAASRMRERGSFPTQDNPSSPGSDTHSEILLSLSSAAAFLLLWKMVFCSGRDLPILMIAYPRTPTHR